MKKWQDKAREIMLAKDISTQDMADALGMTPGGVRHYLNGKREPKPDGMRKIAKRLGVSMSELTEDDPRYARDEIERRILDAVRDLDPSTKEMAARIVQGLVAPPPQHTND